MKIINKILRIVFFPIYWMKDVRKQLARINSILAHMSIIYLHLDKDMLYTDREILVNNLIRITKDPAFLDPFPVRDK